MPNPPWGHRVLEGTRLLDVLLPNNRHGVPANPLLAAGSGRATIPKNKNSMVCKQLCLLSLQVPVPPFHSWKVKG